MSPFALDCELPRSEAPWSGRLWLCHEVFGRCNPRRRRCARAPQSDLLHRPAMCALSLTLGPLRGRMGAQVDTVTLANCAGGDRVKPYPIMPTSHATPRHRIPSTVDAGIPGVASPRGRCVPAAFNEQDLERAPHVRTIAPPPYAAFRT